jgi:hypothetical protein
MSSYCWSASEGDGAGVVVPAESLDPFFLLDFPDEWLLPEDEPPLLVALPLPLELEELPEEDDDLWEPFEVEVEEELSFLSADCFDPDVFDVLLAALAGSAFELSSPPKPATTKTPMPTHTTAAATIRARALRRLLARESTTPKVDATGAGGYLNDGQRLRSFLLPGSWQRVEKLGRAPRRTLKL